ncbi:MAG: MTH1187 family thiamine-binding protein [Acidobacteriota bacterium]
MLVELSVTPLGRGTHISQFLAPILKVIDDSGLCYVLTPSGTCIEGDWDEVMEVVKQCHQQARKLSTHVMTTVRIEDEEGATDKLNENIVSVERAAGRELKHLAKAR